ncbi:MAG: hypothetical protein HYY13_11405 [Nitrospirae bacterium]|nr:hypothetical protein [Nitrospirota bacterium]
MRAIVSVVFVASVFLSQLGALWHVLHTAHRVCSAHGDVLHVPQSNGVGEREGWRLDPAADPAPHSHGCLLVTFARGSNGLVPATHAEVAPVLPAGFAPHTEPEPRANGVALYLLAPKHSPPLA